MIDYYPLIFIVRNNEYYCIWCSAEKDGFVKEDNKLIFFESIEKLNIYAKSINIVLQQSHTNFCIDIAMEWLKITGKKNVDSKYFLDFWNIIADLANTFGGEFYGNSNEGIINDLYNKLFYGNNIPALKGDGEEFTPEWREEELQYLTNVIDDGIRVLKSYLPI